MEEIIYEISEFILGYFAILWVGYLIFLLSAFPTVLRKYKEAALNPVIAELNEHAMLPMTIIIPAYNEEHRILNAIISILASYYKNIHLIVVNDGSEDGTLPLLIKQYGLIKIPPAFQKKFETAPVVAYYQSTIVPHLIVIDKEHSPYENSGADCINAGLNICRTPLFLTVDSDTILEPEALSRMLFVYLTHMHCVAIGGDIYVPDRSKIKEGRLLEAVIPNNPVIGIQICEYLRSFLYGREGWSFLGGSLCHPGAFTLLETQAVYEVGGYDRSNFAYDAEIILKLHHEMRKKKHPYSIIYAPSAIAWSEQPNTLKRFWKQRNNWQRGLLRCLSRHKAMIFNPKYGVTGVLAFPYYILFEIFGPVVEGVSYIVFILALCFTSVSLSYFAWFLLLAWGYLLFITMSCVVLSILTYNKYQKKMDVLRIFIFSSMDMIFYRQYRALCALYSSFQYVINRLRSKPE